MKRIILAALGAGMFAATFSFAQAPAGDAAKGKVLFMKNGCYECHGTVGQGGTGPRIAPRTASLAYVPVSYTHLDVYKRQDFERAGGTWVAASAQQCGCSSRKGGSYDCGLGTTDEIQ